MKSKDINTFKQAILDKINQDYCALIEKPRSFGHKHEMQEIGVQFVINVENLNKGLIVSGDMKHKESGYWGRRRLNSLLADMPKKNTNNDFCKFLYGTWNSAGDNLKQALADAILVCTEIQLKNGTHVSMSTEYSDNFRINDPKGETKVDFADRVVKELSSNLTVAEHNLQQQLYKLCKKQNENPYWGDETKFQEVESQISAVNAQAYAY